MKKHFAKKLHNIINEGFDFTEQQNQNEQTILSNTKNEIDANILANDLTKFIIQNRDFSIFKDYDKVSFVKKIDPKPEKQIITLTSNEACLRCNKKDREIIIRTTQTIIYVKSNIVIMPFHQPRVGIPENECAYVFNKKILAYAINVLRTDYNHLIDDVLDFLPTPLFNADLGLYENFDFSSHNDSNDNMANNIIASSGKVPNHDIYTYCDYEGLKHAQYTPALIDDYIVYTYLPDSIKPDKTLNFYKNTVSVLQSAAFYPIPFISSDYLFSENFSFSYSIGNPSEQFLYITKSIRNQEPIKKFLKDFADKVLRYCDTNKIKNIKSLKLIGSILVPKQKGIVFSVIEVETVADGFVVYYQLYPCISKIPGQNQISESFDFADVDDAAENNAVTTSVLNYSKIVADPEILRKITRKKYHSLGTLGFFTPQKKTDFGWVYSGNDFEKKSYHLQGLYIRRIRTLKHQTWLYNQHASFTEQQDINKILSKIISEVYGNYITEDLSLDNICECIHHVYTTPDCGILFFIMLNPFSDFICFNPAHLEQYASELPDLHLETLTLTKN